MSREAGGQSREHQDLVPSESGPGLMVANEFAEVTVRQISTRNGVRLRIDAVRSGRFITLCPLELEALTWQTPEVFSAMIASPALSLGNEAL